MKKIVVLVGILLFGVGVACAQSGLNVRDTIVSFNLGAGNALNKIEGYNWGDHGSFNYGAQVMTIVAPYIGLGFEANGNRFAGVPNSEEISSISVENKVNVDIWNLMLAGRFYLSSMENISRVYIPVGVGVGFSDITIKTSALGTAMTSKDSSTGFAWYAGLGFEEELARNILFGFEARVNGNTAKVDSLGETHHPIYVTVAARLGYKF